MQDRRGRGWRRMEDVRRRLISHLSGRPSEVELALIDRCATLTLYVEMFDRKALEAGGLSERNGRQYLAYSNSLARALAQLGLKPVAAQQMTLPEYLAQRAAENGDQA